MHIRQPLFATHRPTWGALQIAGLYLLLGGLWILFSDEVATKIASDRQMLATISTYKGWGYVLVTAMLLYWLIRRHTAALHASERQLQQVIDAMPVFISYVGTDRRYRFTNRLYKEWFDEEAEGKSIEEVIGKTAYRIGSKYIDKALSGETTSYETTVSLRGQERFLNVTYIPDIAADGRVKGFFVLGQDVTEQKQAQEEQRLWADAFDGCAHGIAIGDPVTHRVVVCNPAFARLHKCRVEDIVGSAILSLYAPADQEQVRRHIEKADQIGHSCFEARMTRHGKDPSTFPVQMDIVSVLGEDGELLYRVVTAQDISERKQAEEKILHQARLLEQINDAVITTDLNLVITGWNPAAERIYGWKTEDVLGKKGQDVLKSEFFNRTRLEIMQELRERHEFSAELTQCRKDGTRIQIETRTVAVQDENDHTVGYVSVNRDITERKRVEEESKSLARFPSENPNPVLRASHEGKIVYANPASEPLRKDWHAQVGDYLPDDLITFIRELSNTGSGKTIDVPCGETIYSLVIAYAPDGKDVNIYGRNITERKRAEEALRRSEALLLQTSEMAKVGGWEFDLQTMGLVWSRETYRIHEVDTSFQPDLEQAINFYAPEAQPIIRQVVQNAIEKGEAFDLELPLITATSKRIWVRAKGQAEFRDGQAVRIFGTFQDITTSKQAEEYLRRFELLSEHSRDTILFMDRKDGRILEANAAAVQAYGYSREELLALTVRDLRAGEVLHLTEQMAQADTEGILFETIHRRKDGSTFPVEVSSQGATIGGVRTLISILRDITERKQAEETLRLKDQLLHLTSEMAKVGGWEFDAETGEGAWTDEVAKIHDLDPAQETNVGIGLSFYAGESRQRVEQAVEEAVKQAKPYDLELEMISAKGNHKWVRTMGLPTVHNGKVVKVQGIFQDITDRKEIEQALQEAHDELERKVQERTAALSEANALLQALMDNMPDHIYFKDLQSRFIRNSRSQATMLGLSDPAETVGKTDFDFFPHAARSYAEEQEVMRSGKPLLNLEEWVVWPDGRETWVSTTKLPLRNSAGETIGIFGISHDITERKQADQAIRQLNADLEKQTEQLQAANQELEAFSYSVSHDLRAPLRAIDGYTRILVEDYEPLLDDEGKRVCGIISGEARRMGRLIDDLLAFSRLGRKQMYSSKIDMRALAVSVLNELLTDADRARLDIQIGKLPAASGDSSLIRQVWMNLLANAIKFTSKKERAIIEIGGKTSKDEFIYSVRDTGAGFEMEYANKLFGVFQRLHSESEFDGTGVGLAIVQRIIHRHGGRVWAEGEVGKGAAFSFSLLRKEHLNE